MGNRIRKSLVFGLVLVLVAVVFAMVPMNVSAEVDVPIAKWKFEEGDGTIAYDSIGEAHGTLTNGPIWTDGVLGGAMEFDGSDDYVDCGYATVGDFGTGPFTVEFWMYRYSHSLYTSIVCKSKYYPSAPGYGWFFNDYPDSIQFTLVPSAAGQYIFSPEGSVPSGVWNYVVGTRDTNDLVTLYINGVAHAQKTISGDISSPSDRLMFGRRDGTQYVGYYHGKLDEVTIYNKALTATEVEEHYGEGQQTIAKWKFDECSETTAYDSADDHDGTIIGATRTTGVEGKAMEFDGVDDYIEVTDSDDFAFSGDFSVEFWVKFYSFPSNDVPFFSQRYDFNNWFGFRLDNAEWLHIYSRGPGGNNEGFTMRAMDGSTWNPSLNQWYHVAFTQNGDNQDFYVNGQDRGGLYSPGGTSFAGPVTNVDSELDIGRAEYWDTIGYLDGCLDEFAFYQRALSPSEILEHYQQPPIAKWKFEDNLEDSIDGHHGTNINGVTFENGLFGRAASFDGIDDYVYVPDDIGLRPNLLSIEAWIMRKGDNSENSHQKIVTYGDHGSSPNYDFSGYQLQLWQYNEIKGKTSATVTTGSGMNNDLDIMGPTISDNQWYHIVSTYDGDTLRLYLNGVEVVSGTPSEKTMDYSNDSDNYLKIGAVTEEDIPIRFFKGLIDEVSFYGRALSASEILEHYQKAPIAKWKFDEGSGLTAYDSIDGNHGTLINGPVWTSGINDGALQFDGVNDYVDAGSGNGMDGLSAFTIEMWLKLGDVSGTSQILFSRGNYWDMAYFLNLYENNIRLWVSSEENVYIDRSTYNTFTSTTQWYHLVATWNGGDTHKIYVNGLEEETYIMNFGGTLGDITRTVGKTFIGVYPTEGHLYYNGLMDDVAFYNRALTPCEVWKHYNDLAPTNEPPVANAGGPYLADEGTEITLDASGSSDPNDDELQYRWDFENDGIWDTSYSLNPTTPYTWYDDYSGQVAVEVYDGTDTDTATSTVTINNVAPTITSFTGPLDPYQVGTLIQATGSFTDPGISDTHIATINWGDESITDASVTGGDVYGEYTYTQAGVYTLKLTVTDDDGGVAEAYYQFVVIFDPEGGFTTGGGWINSPEGAYAADTTLTGKANFGFVSKYKNGMNQLAGNTEFQFKAANLNFHSSDYIWLVIAGAKAQFKGTGIINGDGNYGFMVTAIDGQVSGGGGVDKFRIKIWDKDNNDVIVYDNHMGATDDADPTTTLGGGQIKIHKN